MRLISFLLATLLLLGTGYAGQDDGPSTVGPPLGSTTGSTASGDGAAARPSPSKPATSGCPSFGPTGRTVATACTCPRHTPTTRSFPLVVVFHGAPGTPQEMVGRTGFDALADEQGFAVVYPDAFDDPATSRPCSTTSRRGSRSTRSGSTQRGSPAVRGRCTCSPPSQPTGSRPSRRRAASRTPSTPPAPPRCSRSRGWPTRTSLRSTRATSGGARSRTAGFRGSAGWRSVTDRARRLESACRGGADHVVIEVEGMGHTWPKAGTPLVWEFLAAHPLAR